MKTYSAKPTQVQRKWYIFDASEQPLGRLSVAIATALTGKKKPMFTNHIDCGDYAIVINSGKLQVTGDKKLKKIYYRHSGFPGGLKSASLGEMLEIDSTKVIEKSVKGMLPDNKLRSPRLLRLKIYKDENHNHSAQNPELFAAKRTSKQ